MGFWKWYDRTARVNFAGTLLGLIVDWKGWISGTFGVLGGGMTYFIAAIRGRDPLDVTVLALLVAAALIAIVYFGISILEKRKRREGAPEHAAGVEAGDPSEFLSLREAARILYEEFRGTDIGNFMEWKPNATPDEILDWAATHFLSYVPVEVKRPPSQKWEPLPEKEKNRIRPWDGARGFQDREGERTPYSEPRVRRSDLLRLIAEYKSGPPAPMFKDDASANRMSLLDFMKLAAERGWDVTGQHNLQGVDLLDGLRQAGVDGSLQLWGRLNRYGNRALITDEPLVSIDASHWRDFRFDWGSALTGSANIETQTYNLHKMSEPYTGGYVDVHLNKASATRWLETSARSYKGARDREEAARKRLR